MIIDSYQVMFFVNDDYFGLSYHPEEDILDLSSIYMDANLDPEAPELITNFSNPFKDSVHTQLGLMKVLGITEAESLQLLTRINLAAVD